MSELIGNGGFMSEMGAGWVGVAVCKWCWVRSLRYWWRLEQKVADIAAIFHHVSGVVRSPDSQWESPSLRLRLCMDVRVDE